MIHVVNIRTTPGAIYCGRAMPGRAGSPLGNPFKLRRDIPRERQEAELLAQYKRWLWRQMQSDTPARRELLRLAGLAGEGDITLGCWCKPHACHVDVVKAALEWMLARDLLS